MLIYIYYLLITTLHIEIELSFSIGFTPLFVLIRVDQPECQPNGMNNVIIELAADRRECQYFNGFNVFQGVCHQRKRFG